MAVELNHTIVHATDRDATAAFLTGILGLPDATPYGPFLEVKVANGASLDVMQVDEVHPQHYAFLVSEDEFDVIRERIRSRGLTHWADPFHRNEGINHNDGGRGLYWRDPDGHNLEILTVPYGGWPRRTA